jgi:hypothetical protein
MKITLKVKGNIQSVLGDTKKQQQERMRELIVKIWKEEVKKSARRASEKAMYERAIEPMVTVAGAVAKGKLIRIIEYGNKEFDMKPGFLRANIVKARKGLSEYSMFGSTQKSAMYLRRGPIKRAVIPMFRTFGGHPTQFRTVTGDTPLDQFIYRAREGAHAVERTMDRLQRLETYMLNLANSAIRRAMRNK